MDNEASNQSSTPQLTIPIRMMQPSQSSKQEHHSSQKNQANVTLAIFLNNTISNPSIVKFFIQMFKRRKKIRKNKTYTYSLHRIVQQKIHPQTLVKYSFLLPRFPGNQTRTHKANPHKIKGKS